MCLHLLVHNENALRMLESIQALDCDAEQAHLVCVPDKLFIFIYKIAFIFVGGLTLSPFI